MIIFGAGGHAKVILDILLSQNVKIDCILDDAPNCIELFGIKVVPNSGTVEINNAIIAIGNNKVRKEIVGQFPVFYKNAFHTSAIISSFSKVDEGTVIFANAVINADATIGKHCIINTGAVVEHDCKISDFVHIAQNVSLSGHVSVGEGSVIGCGSSITSGIKIGKWVEIEAGAVILENIPDYTIIKAKNI